MLPYPSCVLFYVHRRQRTEGKAFNNIKAFEKEGRTPNVHDREKSGE